MREYLANLFYFINLALLAPDELPQFLDRAERPLRFAFPVPVLPALATSVAVYYMRDFKDTLYGLVITFTTVLHYVLVLLWSLLFAAVFELFVRWRHPERPGELRTMFILGCYAYLPFVFYLPLAVLVQWMREVGVGYYIPGLLQWGVTLGLVVWSSTILIRSARFAYEVPQRESLRNFLVTNAILVVFPFVVFLVSTIEFVQLLS